MTGAVILDTGPLVALLNRRDSNHAWTKDALSRVSPPLLTCEAVLSEACFLLRGTSGGSEAVFRLLHEELVRVAFSLRGEEPRIGKLLSKYADVPMSFADACLVRMAEQRSRATVLTFDSEFRRYRKNGREVIPVLAP